VKNYVYVFMCVCLCFISACSPQKCADPVAIMKEMIAQESHLDYAATKTITRMVKGEPYTVRLAIARKAPDSFRLQFSAPEELAGQGFVRVGPNFWRISNGKEKGERHFRMRGMHKNLEIKNLDLLLNNYSLRCRTMEKVGKRPCYVIEVEPKKGSPLSCRLWIDQARYLTLKAEEYHGKALKSSFRFDDITFHPKFDANTFSVPVAAGAQSIMSGTSREEVTFDDAARELKIAVFSPAYIPEGYQRAELKLFKRGKKEFLHAVYSDGLSSISLFQGKPSKRPDRWKERRQEIKKDGQVVYRIKRGPLTILSAGLDGTEVTLMGEIGQDELARMFSSLKKVAQ